MSQPSTPSGEHFELTLGTLAPDLSPAELRAERDRLRGLKVHPDLVEEHRAQLNQVETRLGLDLT